MMKYFALLAALSACAFAAPATFMESDALVPELNMVELPDHMDALRAEFEELRTAAKSGSMKTAGITATVDKMIKMVKNKIEPMILSAHETDQTTLNDMMAAIGTHNAAFVTQEKNLQEDANNVRKLIDDEQAKSKTWENQASTFTTSQNTFLGEFKTQTASCCRRDQAAVMSVEYVPAYAECDYKIQSTSGGCADRAKNDVNDVVSSPFTEGLTRYRNARKECNDDTTALNSAESDTANQFSKCGSDKAAAVAASNLAAKEQKRMQGEWDAAVKKYKGTYDKLYSAYKTTENRVRKDDKDRTEEWGAMQEIKCMLNEYKKSHVFDDSTHADCAKSVVKADVVDIGYPTHIKRIEPKLEPFEAQADDSAYENTCNKRTPSPAFACTVAGAKPLPTCNTHKQPPAPAHKHHKGPWSGEVEAKCWQLKAGQRSPSAGGAATTGCEKKKSRCNNPKFPFPSRLASNICYTKKKYVNGGPNPGCSSWCCTDSKCRARCNVNLCSGGTKKPGRKPANPCPGGKLGRSPGTSLGKTQQSTFDACKALCRRTRRCKSVVYHFKVRVCYMLPRTYQRRFQSSKTSCVANIAKSRGE